MSVFFANLHSKLRAQADAVAQTPEQADIDASGVQDIPSPYIPNVNPADTLPQIPDANNYVPPDPIPQPIPAPTPGQSQPIQMGSQDNPAAPQSALIQPDTPASTVASTPVTPIPEEPTNPADFGAVKQPDPIALVTSPVGNPNELVSTGRTSVREFKTGGAKELAALESAGKDQQAGVDAEYGAMQAADAQKASGLAQKAIVDQQGIDNQQANKKAFEEHYAAASKTYDEAVNKLSDMSVNSNHLWQNTSTSNKVAAAIGIAFGAIGQGLMGTKENAAMEVINKAIDRDIDDQKTNIQAQQGVVDRRKGVLGELREKLSSSDAADIALKQASWNKVDDQVNGLLATTQGSIDQGKALQLKAQIKEKIAQLQYEKSVVLQKDTETYQTKQSLTSPSMAQQKAGIETLSAAKKLAGYDDPKSAYGHAQATAQFADKFDAMMADAQKNPKNASNIVASFFIRNPEGLNLRNAAGAGLADTLGFTKGQKIEAWANNLVGKGLPESLMTNLSNAVHSQAKAAYNDAMPAIAGFAQEANQADAASGKTPGSSFKFYTHPTLYRHAQEFANKRQSNDKKSKQAE